MHYVAGGVRVIEIDGVKYLTRAQWERKHRHIRKNARGVDREWRSPVGKKSATYYRESQTYPWSDRERRAERERKEAERAEEAIQERIRAEVASSRRAHDIVTKAAATRCPDMLFEVDPERCGFDGVDGLDGVLEWLDYLHTSWQWIHAGFVPRPDAHWTVGYAEGYWYCRVWDVLWDPDRAAELEESGPKLVDRLPDGTPYDGKPWW